MSWCSSVMSRLTRHEPLLAVDGSSQGMDIYNSLELISLRVCGPVCMEKASVSQRKWRRHQVAPIKPAAVRFHPMDR